MADNVGYTPGDGVTIAADDVGGVLVQRVKLTFGGDGVADDVATGNGLPVDTGLTPLTDAQLRASVVQVMFPAVLAEDAPLEKVVKRANIRSELRYPLYFPVVYRKEARPARDESAAQWGEVLIAADAAYRHYKQLQDEEDIAYVMSILAAM